MNPYWQSRDGRAVLYHGDSIEVLPTLAADSVGICITDPPFAEETHKGARTSKGAKSKRDAEVLIDFAPLSPEQIAARFAEVARVLRGWLIATVDWRHVHPLETNPPAGLEFIRFGVWTKWNGAPQKTGDRPAAGWEAVVHLHRPGRKRWNGGGRPAVYRHGVELNGEWATQKPLPLIREFLHLFAQPGDVVLDPFCGSGTTLVAALDRGHTAIGIDISEKALAIARRRCEEVLNQGSLFGGAA